MICLERLRLAVDYQFHVQAFRDAVLDLLDLRGLQFRKAYAASEQFRVSAKKARIALQDHRKVHRC
jgi:hypothetical protein